MLLRSSKIVFVVLVLTLILPALIGGETPEDAHKRKAWLVKKHIKRLKKVEGAIKLVGGKGEYEGELMTCLLYFYRKI